MKKVDTNEYMMNKMMQWVLHRYGEEVVNEMCESIGMEPSALDVVIAMNEAWRERREYN